MTAERRYGDDEVREIFALAARRDAREVPARRPADGPTLAELQEIGSEAGLEPAAVARAAAAMETRAVREPRRTSLGMPIAVGRVVPLPRPLSDGEWEHLVAMLRTTFGARGRVSSHGNLRQWTNGNLHVCLEPAASGYRLRMGTLKGDAAAINALGVTGVVTGAIAFGAMLATGGLAEAIVAPWLIGGSGVAAVLANALRLPAWASRRERQMNAVADGVAAMVVEPRVTGPDEP